MIFRKLSLATAVVASACTLQSANAQDPPTQSIFEIANETPQFSMLADALVATGLAEFFSCTENCDPLYTVFAPDNTAFENIDFPPPIGIPQLRDILGYHVLGMKVESDDLSDGLVETTGIGEDVTFNLNPARINGNDLGPLLDVQATNGVIHQVDAVLKPSSVTQNLVDKLVAATTAVPAEFTTLVTLVLAAGLAEDLANISPLTVFAPTDEAFANLFGAFPGVDEYLTDPMNKGVLQKILKLHVSPANVDSLILKEAAEPFGNIKIPTLTEDYIMVTVSDDGIMINDSNVVLANIIANNGVAHGIDAVLLPDGFVFPPPEPSSKSAKRGTYSPTTDSLPSAKSGKGGKRQQSMMGLQRMRQRDHMTNTDQEVMTAGGRGRLNDRLSRVSTDEDEETLEESEQSMLF